ncbi:ABC-type hemin transport system, periplasmic component [Hahella chejuensis KCTC 2396]|uniref:ABC-type hemin transport system, periplasmic component n=1 Tax=Hahella chejuensis (strain KCTC 2396) TaxID=349521 RepID=Q2SB49_HAHCH|nr:hemin ABC transporter substrate-binding protein [Hahella chejuensis]ABC32125.1 ABC-type hemin transport system, periplasmic component [Hahella chejuensis KCTC 2396]
MISVGASVRNLSAGWMCAALLSIFSVAAQAATPTPAPERMQRILSVGGAVTEIVYALDQEQRLIGSDITSYFPAEAENMPKVGYQRSLSAEGILALRPDAVLASEEAGPPTVLKQLKGAGTTWFTVPTAQDLEGVYANIRQIGYLLGAETRAEKLITDMQAQQQQLEQEKAHDQRHARVLFVLQHSGGAPMVAGANTAADRIIRLSGAVNALQGVEGYKPMTPESLAQAQPDLILTTTLGMEQVGGVDAMRHIPGVSLTPAGRNEKIVAMDGLLLLGFGPRTVVAARQLRQTWME